MAGGNPGFYRIKPDTRPDLAELKARITERTRMLVAVHYFGFLQPMAELRALCDARGTLLLEDCAHTLYGESDGVRVGGTGDYAIASAMKFLPMFCGGYLASSTRDLSQIGLTSAGTAFELKATVNTLEVAVAYGRLGIVGRVLAGTLTVKRRSRGASAASGQRRVGGAVTL